MSKEAIKKYVQDYLNSEAVSEHFGNYSDSLQRDFETFTKNFGRFIERRCDILNIAPEFKIMDAMEGLLNAFYDLKVQYLRGHYEMLMDIIERERSIQK